jgi:hypothetical protein
MKLNSWITTGLLLVASFVAVSAQAARENDGDRSCLSDDGREDDQTWPLFEKSVPECKRVIVTLNRDAKLDLGDKPETYLFKTGMTALKVKVLTGKGVYHDDNRAEDLSEVTLWVSVDRCEMRTLVFSDAKDKDISGLTGARYVRTTDEVTVMVNSDELKRSKDTCPKK